MDMLSGSAPATVNVNVDIAGLAAGTHSGQITASAGGATGSPQVIAVTLVVHAGPGGDNGLIVFLPIVNK
jgi:hypothetical protein